jgi:hypothetical protein
MHVTAAHHKTIAAIGGPGGAACGFVVTPDTFDVFVEQQRPKSKKCLLQSCKRAALGFGHPHNPPRPPETRRAQSAGPLPRPHIPF